jgi:hypothetical protein
MKTWLAGAVLAQIIVAFPGSHFPRIPPYLPVPHGAAVIMRTGSTNTTGYRIVLTRDGQATYVSATGQGRGAIPVSLANKFFADLQSAMPLDRLPTLACMKSASFGTSLFVYWNHHRSPDVTCSGDVRAAALARDADAIAGALGISVRSGVLRPMLPNEMHRPAPTPSP